MERKIIYSCKRGTFFGKFTVDLQETTKRVVTNLFMTVSPVWNRVNCFDSPWYASKKQSDPNIVHKKAFMWFNLVQLGV